MSPSSLLNRLALVPGMLLLSGGCGDQGPADPVASTLSEVSGNDQTGPAGQPLGQPLVVKVTTAAGTGVAGVQVSFAVTEGAGNISATSRKTNAQGEVAITWTLGPAAGTSNNRATASATGLDGSPVTFTASATANATIAGTVTLTNAFLPSPSGGSRAARLQRRSGTTALDASPGVIAASTPDELIVTLRPTVAGLPPLGSRVLATRTGAQAAAAAIRAHLAARLPQGEAEVVGVSPAIATARIRARPERLAEIAEWLQRDPAIAAVERNAFVALSGNLSTALPTAAPSANDPLIHWQAWHHGMVDLPEAWAITTGSPAVLVAEVGDGIRFDHPDLAANLTADGFDFVSSLSISLCSATGAIDNAGDGDSYDADPTIPASYSVRLSPLCAGASRRFGGISMAGAGTIGAVADNGLGVAGVNWTLRLRSVRVLGLAGVGTTYDVAQGVLYAAALPADDGMGGVVTPSTAARVIVLAFGGPDADVVRNAVTVASNVGALIVAPSGSAATAEPVYPAAYPEVLSVSALGPDRQLASYSSFGPTIDIAAPGGDFADADASDPTRPGFGMMSTLWDFQNAVPAYLSASGFPEATVAGVAALLLAKEPTLTGDQLRSRLTTFAVDAGTPGPDDLYGAGIVNARNSLTQSFAPPQTTYVRLYDALTGAVLQTVATQPDGSYAFTALPDGQYHVFAGQDADGDQLLGVPGRRWGAFGGPAAPTPVAVAGAGNYPASFAIGYPVESEPNNSSTEANVLHVGGYLHGHVAGPGSLDFVRVLLPTGGQYTFETSAWDGACGFTLEENTILRLYDAGGNPVASNDDIDAPTSNLCSRLEGVLSSGTYYLSVDGSLGRRYRISARAGIGAARRVPESGIAIRSP